MTIRPFCSADLPRLCEIWNEVVKDGQAFPQEDLFNEETGEAFFSAQSRTAVAEDDGEICGLYILHPNNVGRCGHIANASYAVASRFRGQKIGELLVRDSLEQARRLGFRLMQFNAVVEQNTGARRLYEKLGFVGLGVIPGGFRRKDGMFVNICPYYITL